MTLEVRNRAYSEALFGSYDMDNSLTAVGHSKICQSEFLDIRFQGQALFKGIFLLDERLGGGKVLARRSARDTQRQAEVRRIWGDSTYGIL